MSRLHRFGSVPPSFNGRLLGFDISAIRSGMLIPLVLGVSVYMVRSLIRQRRLPYYRVGRRIVLDREDLERFLQADRVEAREIRVDPPRAKTTTHPKVTGIGTLLPRPLGGSSDAEVGGQHA